MRTWPRRCSLIIFDLSSGRVHGPSAYTPPLKPSHILTRCIANAPAADPSESVQPNERLRPYDAARRPQGRRIHVDPLLRDASVAQPELVDAAPIDPPPAGGARRLPFDDHDVATRRPVEQLPDMVGRCLAHQFGEATQFLAGHRPVVER